MAAGTVGFVLLIGYAHQLALGQAGFLMIGGYANAILSTRYRWIRRGAARRRRAVDGDRLGDRLADHEAARVRARHGVARDAAHLHRACGRVRTSPAARSAPRGCRNSRSSASRSTNDSRILLRGVGDRVHLRRHRPQCRSFLHRPRLEGNRRERDGRRLGRHRASNTRCRCSWSSAAWRARPGASVVHYLRAMDPNVFGFAYSLNLHDRR